MTTIRLRAPVTQAREKVSAWLKERGIYRDLYELGYDMVGESEEGIHLAPVLRIDDGVLADSDVTEFILRFGV